MHNAPHIRLLSIHHQIRRSRRLIRIIHPGESLDLPRARTRIHAPAVRLLRILEAGRNVDEVEVAVLADLLARVLARILVRGDGGSDHSRAGLGQLSGDEADAADVAGAVRAAEAELGGELGAHSLAEEERDGAAALLVQGYLQGARDGVLAGVLVAGEEDSEALRGAGLVGVAEHLDDLGVGEPLWDLAAGAQARAQLGAGDVEGAGALGDLVDGLVLVRVGKVRHHLEGDDLDAELLAVLLHGVLRIVGTVELNARAVLAGAGVVAADDEVRRAMVLADDGVPDGLAGTAHAHGEGEETQDGHAVGVAWEQGLVHAHAREVVDVAGLGEANDGVDEHVGLAGARSADGQLAMGAVHGVTGLEGDDAGPA
ncbi:hypothetical protein V498_10389 [Pseudogymnoascus sp. VKM F-4517 (FW-2822)]|nr:hypothetical protein V498_10389 [Pseudogymnoascus sp. VKM F-4517 (FW-2822)]